MKTLRLFILTLGTLFLTSPSEAFFSLEEEQVILVQLNERYPLVQFEEIRCSIRNRRCRLYFANERGSHACVLHRLGDAQDVLHVQMATKSLKLTPYAEEALSECIAEAR